MTLTLTHRQFTTLLAAIVFFTSINVFAESASVKLNAEHWDMQRHGEGVLKIEPLSDIVKRWQASSGKIIEIRYPGGEEGILWVEELRSWLVSLGIPSEALSLTPGSEAKDIINLTLIDDVRGE